MTILKRLTHRIEAKAGSYRITIQDYGYTSRPPVAVRVSGTVDGECRNSFGEPCFFYQSEDAMSLTEGMAKAQAIVTAQHATPLGGEAGTWAGAREGLGRC